MILGLHSWHINLSLEATHHFVEEWAEAVLKSLRRVTIYSTAAFWFNRLEFHWKRSEVGIFAQLVLVIYNGHLYSYEEKLSRD